MFDSKQTLTDRLANAVDLAIDFATLGEYGLEPVGSAPCPELRSCEADARVRVPQALSNRPGGAPRPAATRPRAASRATSRRAQLGDLYALRLPRPAATSPACTSRMQANPFSS